MKTCVEAHKRARTMDEVVDVTDETMKAVVRAKYGGPDVLSYMAIGKPVPGDDEVRIRVHSVSLNQSDWECLTGKPLYARIFGLFRPRFRILGTDVAGTVEAIGENVRRFAVGDAVYGDAMGINGALSEFAVLKEKMLHPKPSALSFDAVSTVPQAGSIAIQGLRWGGELQLGQRVLINGAGGGSGMFAIQLAKRMGAVVTGVDNERKLQHMRDLGADFVLDYRRVDFAQADEKYDHILDLVATRSVFAILRALRPGGTYAVVGGTMRGLLGTLFLGPLVGFFTGKKLGVLAAEPRVEDYEQLLSLLESGELKLTIDHTYRLEQAAAAIASVGRGQALGKVIVQVT